MSAANRVFILADINNERTRQIEKGWSEGRDIAIYQNGELAQAAGVYAQLTAVKMRIAAQERVYAFTERDAQYQSERIALDWPWGEQHMKHHKLTDREALIQAAAMIVAQIEVIDDGQTTTDAAE